MSTDKVLPNYYYRIATAVSLLAVIAFSYKTRNFTEVWKYAVLAVAVAELAVFIKEYKRDDHKWYELFQSGIAPLSVYLFIYMARLKGLIKESMIGLAIVLIISLAYIGILFAVNVISKGKRNTEYIRKMAAVGLYRVRPIILVVVSLQLIYMASESPVQSIADHNDTQILKAWSEERTIAANYDTLKVLSDENEFVNVKDVDARKEIFACAVDVESNYLGIPYEIIVQVRNLDEGIAAQYSDSYKTIAIDENYLKNCTAEELIKTAAHECRHAYQCQLIQLYEKIKDDEESMIFLEGKLEHVEEYMNEFKDYKTCDDSIEEYLNQYSEIDSYSYAEERCEQWRERFEEIEEGLT